MAVDKRMLGIAACAIVIGVSAVVIATKIEAIPQSSPLSEIVVPGSPATAEPLEGGLRIAVSSSALTVVVPDCNVQQYGDNFFVHVFTQPHKASSKYANFDFNLAGERGVKILVDGRTACRYTRKYSEVTVAEVTVGQFASPAGVCCKILWSRNYVFDGVAVENE